MLFQQNSGATREAGEPSIGDGHTVWYRWIPPSNGLVTFDTVGPWTHTTFDTALAAFIGDDVTNLTLVAANDDINPWKPRLRESWRRPKWHVFVQE